MTTAIRPKQTIRAIYIENGRLQWNYLFKRCDQASAERRLAKHLKGIMPEWQVPAAINWTTFEVVKPNR